MNAMDLWDSFRGLDPELLERSEKPRVSLIRRAAVPSLIAASLVLVLLAASPLMMRMGSKSEAPAMDGASNSFGFSEPQEAIVGAAPEYTGAPESAEGLIFNDLSQCDVPTYPVEPLAGEVQKVPLSEEIARSICPADSVREAKAIYHEDGGLLRVSLEVPVAGTDAVICLSAAPDLYNSDLPPSFRADNPGEAAVSHIGSTECLAVQAAVRAPRGTGWNMEVVFRCADTDYALSVYAAPGEATAVTGALEDLIRRIDAEAAPNFDLIIQEEAQP